MKAKVIVYRTIREEHIVDVDDAEITNWAAADGGRRPLSAFVTDQADWDAHLVNHETLVEAEPWETKLESVVVIDMHPFPVVGPVIRFDMSQRHEHDGVICDLVHTPKVVERLPRPFPNKAT